MATARECRPTIVDTRIAYSHYIEFGVRGVCHSKEAYVEHGWGTTCVAAAFLRANVANPGATRDGQI
jgi:hypothetical protein